MNNLFFIVDNLLSPTLRHAAKLPFTFISYGMSFGKLYRINRDTVFLLPDEEVWGNRVVYGGVFALSDSDYYAGIMDAMHGCSRHALGRNHVFDLQHRVEGDIILIQPQSLSDLINLRYWERGIVKCNMYIGNTEHPRINQVKHNTNHPKRIVSGTNKHIIEQFQGENYESIK